MSSAPDPEKPASPAWTKTAANVFAGVIAVAMFVALTLVLVWGITSLYRLLFG